MQSPACHYIDCSIPEGMTIDEYRRSRHIPPRRGLAALVTRRLYKRRSEALPA